MPPVWPTQAASKHFWYTEALPVRLGFRTIRGGQDPNVDPGDANAGGGIGIILEIASNDCLTAVSAGDGGAFEESGHRRDGVGVVSPRLPCAVWSILSLFGLSCVWLQEIEPDCRRRLRRID